MLISKDNGDHSGWGPLQTCQIAFSWEMAVAEFYGYLWMFVVDITTIDHWGAPSCTCFFQSLILTREVVINHQIYLGPPCFQKKPYMWGRYKIRTRIEATLMVIRTFGSCTICRSANHRRQLFQLSQKECCSSRGFVWPLLLRERCHSTCCVQRCSTRRSNPCCSFCWAHASGTPARVDGSHHCWSVAFMVNIATSSSLSLHPVPQTLQTYSCTYSLPTLFFSLESSTYFFPGYLSFVG